MSIRVPRAQLSRQQAEQVVKDLNIRPETKKRWDNAYESVPEPVRFYELDGDDLVVPFRYGIDKLGAIPNPTSYPEIRFNFTANLFDHQTPVVAEALQQLGQYGTTTLSTYPGSGKTVMGAYLGALLHGLLLVVCHRDVLIGQWEKTFREKTTARVWVNGSPPPDGGAHVIITMDGAIQSLPLAYRKQIKVVIYDEAHCLCTESRSRNGTFLGLEPLYVIIETATLVRDDGMHRMVHAVAGQHQVVLANTKSFKVVKLLTGVNPPTEKNVRGGTDFSKLATYLATDQDRINIIASVIIVLAREHKIVVLSGRKSECLELQSKLLEFGQISDTLFGTKKSYTDSKVLLGTLPKIGIGFDEASSCPDWDGIRIDVVILTVSFKSLPLLEQSIGRAFRSSYPIVVHLVDKNRIIEGHFRECKKLYLSKGGEIIIQTGESYVAYAQTLTHDLQIWRPEFYHLNSPGYRRAVLIRYLLFGDTNVSKLPTLESIPSYEDSDQTAWEIE